MRKALFCIAVMLVAAVIISSVSLCFAESKYDKKVEKCATVMDEIMMMPEGGIPEGLLSDCKAIAISRPRSAEDLFSGPEAEPVLCLPGREMAHGARPHF